MCDDRLIMITVIEALQIFVERAAKRSLYCCNFLFSHEEFTHICCRSLLRLMNDDAVTRAMFLSFDEFKCCIFQQKVRLQLCEIFFVY